MIGQFAAHGFDFRLHGDVFLFLAREVVAGQFQFGAEAFRGEQVGVIELVFCPQEVAGFDVAFCQQGFDQVVGLAQADAQDFGKPPLADFEFRLDDYENTELGLYGRVHGFSSWIERDGTGFSNIFKTVGSCWWVWSHRSEGAGLPRRLQPRNDRVGCITRELSEMMD